MYEESINALVREIMEAEVNEHGLHVQHFYMSRQDALPTHILSIRPPNFKTHEFSLQFDLGDDDYLEELDRHELIDYLFGVMEYLLGIFELGKDWTNDDD